MKKLVLVLGIIFSMLLPCVATQKDTIPATSSTYQKRILDRNSPEAKARRRQRQMERTGGIIEDFSTRKGRFLYLNAQQRVPVSELAELTVGTMGQFFRSDFALVPWNHKFNVNETSGFLSAVGAQAGVFIVDDATLPSLLIAPENNWGLINVAALAVDKPGSALLAQRVRREMWRVLGYMYGAESPAALCVLQNVSTLRDLDGIRANALSQLPLASIKKRLPEIGIKPVRISTYKEACRQGWAPPPTNEYQRAIWVKERSVPKNPMKIEFDPKKGR